jgi:hypothetical protein
MMSAEFMQHKEGQPVKYLERWPPTYYEAINQLADVIATFSPEEVPPFELREVADDLEIHYDALFHAVFSYHCVQSWLR